MLLCGRPPAFSCCPVCTAVRSALQVPAACLHPSYLFIPPHFKVASCICATKILRLLQLISISPAQMLLPVQRDHCFGFRVPSVILLALTEGEEGGTLKYRPDCKRRLADAMKEDASRRRHVRVRAVRPLRPPSHFLAPPAASDGPLLLLNALQVLWRCCRPLAAALRAPPAAAMKAQPPPPLPAHLPCLHCCCRLGQPAAGVSPPIEALRNADKAVQMHQ